MGIRHSFCSLQLEMCVDIRYGYYNYYPSEQEIVVILDKGIIDISTRV